LVCKEYIENGTTLKDLTRKYNISSHSLIYDWLRKYGYLKSSTGTGNITTTVLIGIENYNKVQLPPSIPESNLPSSPNESDNSEIIRLKRELLEAQIKAEAYQRIIEIAEQELKIPIRKKYNSK
jgi:transposase